MLQVRVAVVLGLKAEHAMLRFRTWPMGRVRVEVLDLGHLRLFDHLVDGVGTELLVGVEHLHVVVPNGLLLDHRAMTVVR